MYTSVPMARRVSPFLFAIILITLLLSLLSIYEGINEYLSGEPGRGSLYMTMGLTALALSAYMLFQTKRRMLKFGLEMQPLTATLLCQKCGFKNIREFTRGDYVFKRVEEPCPKCNEKTVMIGSIYREVKEKLKARQEV